MSTRIYRTKLYPIGLLCVVIGLAQSAWAATPRPPVPVDVEKTLSGKMSSETFRHDGKKEYAFAITTDSGKYSISGGGKSYNKIKKYVGKNVTVKGKVSVPKQGGQFIQISSIKDVTLVKATKKTEDDSFKILMIIAQKAFSDAEFSTSRTNFEKAGAVVVVGSVAVGNCLGAGGAKVEATLAIKDAKAEDYAAVVFVGGPGTQALFDNAQAHSLAKATLQKKKVLAAICLAPIILAKAGVLDGTKATVWDDKKKTFSKMLTGAGATFLKESVVQSGDIVTANGPDAAKSFASAVCKMVKKKATKN